MLLINNTLTKQTGTVFGTVRIRISQSISALAASAFLAAACTPSVQRFPITDYGAENGTVCTEAIQQALDKASEAGGGQVVIPEGTFLSATLYLRDNVDLHLEEGAVLQGVQDPDAYQPYIPENDLTRYDSGNGTANSNCVNDRQWMKAFLIGAGVKNASITGSGTIDGVHVFDERGEENMRGPHTIIVAEAENFHMSGVHITRAANYAFLGYALVKPVFEDLLVTEGWDGIHIRGCENGVIRRSQFQTGDDCIAGGYWNQMLIEDCDINSSCNGIRMIMPSDGLEVRNCVLHGPGVYPHRTSGEARRCNMLFGIELEPGAWGKAEGTARNIYLHDLQMYGLSSPVGCSVRKGSVAEDLTLENLSATGLTGAAIPVVSWNDEGFQKITLRGVEVSRD